MPHIQINDKISLFYEEYGTGALDADNIILIRRDKRTEYIKNALKTNKWYLPVEE